MAVLEKRCAWGCGCASDTNIMKDEMGFSGKKSIPFDLSLSQPQYDRSYDVTVTLEVRADSCRCKCLTVQDRRLTLLCNEVTRTAVMTQTTPWIPPTQVPCGHVCNATRMTDTTDCHSTNHRLLQIPQPTCSSARPLPLHPPTTSPDTHTSCRTETRYPTTDASPGHGSGIA